MKRKSIVQTAARSVLVAALLGCSVAHANELADAAALLKSGKHAEALAKADQYLSGKPRDPQMRFLRGVILTEAARINDAISAFTKLTEDFPELPEPYNNLAVLHASQGQFDKARGALEMAIRTNPSYAVAHENLGDVYAKLASQAYSKALQLDAGNTAVPPKLSLIRDLFSTTNRGVRPTAPAPVSLSAPVPAAAPAPSARPASLPVAAPPPAPAAAPAPMPASASKPAAAPPAVPPAPPVGASSGNKEVEAAVLAWASAWSSRDMRAYLGAYGSDFDPPGNLSRKAWEEERRARIMGKSKISVRLSDLQVQVQGSKAVARFRQSYSADALHVAGRKTLELARVGERWVIVKESAGS